MSAIKIIQGLARKSLIKDQGSGIRSIPSVMEAEAKAGEIAAILQSGGMPLQQLDNYIRSEKDLLKYLNIIKNANKPRVIAGDSPEGKGIMEALLGKRGEVVDMAGKKLDTSQGIMGGKSVKELMDSGQVSKGARGMKKSKKVQDREMFQGANKRLKTDVNKIIADIKAMDPMDSMKEANSVIGRKGAYKNLTPEESKKILQDTEDHIFERNIPEDPEDFADGGVAGLLGERTSFGGGGTMGASDKGYQGGGRDKKGNVSGTAPGAAPGPGGNNNDGPKGPPGTTTTGGKTTTTPTLNRGFLSDVRKKNQQKYLNLLKTMKPDDFSTDSIIDDTTGLSDEELNFLSRYGIGTVLKDLSKTNIENFMDITDGVAPKVEDLEMDVDRPRKYDFAELGKTPLDNLALGVGAGKVLSGIFKAGKGIKPYREGTDIGVKYETLDKPFNTDFFKFKGGVNLEDTLKDAYETGNIKVKPQIGIEGSKGGVNYGITYDKDGNAKFNLFKKFADGGPARQNFAMGKRAFLKMLAGAGAGIAGLKSGLIGFGGKEATKKAVTETVKSAGSGTPPPYFFRLVEKIKFMGDDALATQDKAIAKKYKDYTMEEDFAGNIEIIKKGDNVAEDVYISYKVDDVPLRGKKGSKRVEEYEEYTARPDAEGKMKDIEQGVPDEVIDEAGDTTAMTLKRASGGIARMLGE